MTTIDPAPAVRRPAWMPTTLLGTPAGVLAYLGGLGLLAGAAVRAAIRPRQPAPPLARAVARQLDGLFAAGLPLVTLVHVPMGSFLAMQAYFHATFREAVGAVVGVGLLRNLAPLLAGMVLTALLAVRIVPELRRDDLIGLDDDPFSVPDRDVTRGERPDDRPAPEPARLAAARLIAAAIAGPVLAVWGALVGLGIGLLIARSMLSVAPGMFFGKLGEMVQPGDSVSLVGKAALFGVISALFACHEGLRPGSDRASVAAATLRAICLALLVMLVVNGCWFSLEYLSGAPLGPSLAPR